MQENESRFWFFADALNFYEGLANPLQVVEFWEQISFLLEQSYVDNETVFEISDGMESYKVMYGPSYTIVFRDEPDGSMDIFSIRRSGLLRREG